MSISREQGHTISETWKLYKKLNENSPIPFKICLDVDHGDQTSPNLNDRDPYQWLENFADFSPQIHLKQSLYENSNSNYPFLEKSFNIFLGSLFLYIQKQLDGHIVLTIQNIHIL
jgi:hypothetical protein